MAFTSRRGRPKTVVEAVDKGTPELRRRHQKQLTLEPLDWLFLQEVISEKQQWCGLHFRWLYTLRYGAFTPQSLDATQLRGVLRKREYEEWQQEREKEWQQTMGFLREAKLLRPALSLCVYLQSVPKEWRKSHQNFPPAYREALQMLEQHWRRNTKP